MSETVTQTDSQVYLTSTSLSCFVTPILAVAVPGASSPPVICGYNTGQHMYVPACPSCVTITIDVDTATTATRKEMADKVE